MKSSPVYDFPAGWLASRCLDTGTCSECELDIPESGICSSSSSELSLLVGEEPTTSETEYNKMTH